MTFDVEACKFNIADSSLRVEFNDGVTGLTVSYYPPDAAGRFGASVYAEMDDEGCRSMFIEMSLADAYVLAMMLNEALGLEVKG